jgi:hypothetical protein
MIASVSAPVTVVAGTSRAVLFDDEVEALRQALARLSESMLASRRAPPAFVARLQQLDRSLAGSLASAQPALLELDGTEGRLLARVLGDLTGYQRGSLSDGLLQLRRALDT